MDTSFCAGFEGHWVSRTRKDPSTLGLAANALIYKSLSKLNKVEYYPFNRLGNLVLEAVDPWRAGEGEEGVP